MWRSSNPNIHFENDQIAFTLSDASGAALNAFGSACKTYPGLGNAWGVCEQPLASLPKPEGPRNDPLVKNMAKRFHKSSSSRRDGFTLIELLVVVSIIGALVAMLLPAVNAVA